MSHPALANHGASLTLVIDFILMQYHHRFIECLDTAAPFIMMPFFTLVGDCLCVCRHVQREGVWKVSTRCSFGLAHMYSYCNSLTAMLVSCNTPKKKQAPPLIYRFFSNHFRLPSSCLLLEQYASSLEALCRATFSNKARSSTSLFGWLCCHKVSHFPLFSSWVFSNILKTMRTTNSH